MKSKKIILLTGLVYLIIFGIYNLLVFTIFSSRTDVFWFSYTFMAVALVIHIICVSLALKNRNVETLFFGIPLISLSIYYGLAELFVSIVFMIFQSIGLTTALVVQAVLLGIFLVVMIISVMARDVAQDIDSKIKKSVNFIKSINVDIEMILMKCTDPELKIKLKKLSETVKYSDPMSNDIVADLDQMIIHKVSELRILCENMQIKEAAKDCSEIELLFVERNKKLMLSK